MCILYLFTGYEYISRVIWSLQGNSIRIDLNNDDILYINIILYIAYATNWTD